MSPRVSVVIPVYNRPDFALEAIASVLDTGYDGLEVVVVDDGSSDGSGDSIAARHRGDQRVRVIRQPDGRNHGPGVARNLGIRSASADRVCFLDSDDLVRPHRFDRAMEILDSQPEVDGVFEWTTTLIAPGGEGRRGTVRPLVSFDCERPEHVLAKIVRDGRHWSTDAILVRRSVLLRVGGFSEDTRLRGFEDLVLWLKLAAASRLVLGSTDPVAIYRLHGSNVSSVDRRRHILCPALAYREAHGWARREQIPAEPLATLRSAACDKLFFACGELRKQRLPGEALRLLAGVLPADASAMRDRRFWGNLVRASLEAAHLSRLPADMLPGQGGEPPPAT